MLGGGLAAVLPGVAGWPGAGAVAQGASAPAAADARIAVLAARYRRASAALVDWVEAAELWGGPFAYETRDAWRGRYQALVARDRRCTRDLARARPASLRGVVLKLRPAFYCDDLRAAEADCDAEILMAALGDLERLVGG